MTPSEEFGQLRLKFTDPVQHHYEVIRPIVLFSESISERSRQTGVERTQVGEKAQRFVQQGMFGLADQRAGKAGRKPGEYPEPVAAHILYLKQLYPPIHYHEIVRIVERQFGYKTNHHTVKGFLARYPIPVQLELDFPVPTAQQPANLGHHLPAMALLAQVDVAQIVAETQVETEFV